MNLVEGRTWRVVFEVGGRNYRYITEKGFLKHEPLKWLNANSMGSWQARAKPVRQWVQAGKQLRAENGIPALEHVRVDVETFKAVRRDYDPHNLYPSFKAAMDGLVREGGMLPDDNYRFLHRVSFDHGGFCKPGALVLNVVELVEVT